MTAGPFFHRPGETQGPSPQVPSSCGTWGPPSATQSTRGHWPARGVPASPAYQPPSPAVSVLHGVLGASGLGVWDGIWCDILSHPGLRDCVTHSPPYGYTRGYPGKPRPAQVYPSAPQQLSKTVAGSRVAAELRNSLLRNSSQLGTRAAHGVILT